MINPDFSSIPAKNPPNFGARPHKIANCEKNTPFKTLKTFLLICAPLLPHLSIYQEENANKALFIYFDMRAIINQN